MSILRFLISVLFVFATLPSYAQVPEARVRSLDPAQVLGAVKSIKVEGSLVVFIDQQERRQARAMGSALVRRLAARCGLKVDSKSASVLTLHLNAASVKKTVTRGESIIDESSSVGLLARLSVLRPGVVVADGGGAVQVLAELASSSRLLFDEPLRFSSPTLDDSKLDQLAREIGLASGSRRGARPGSVALSEEVRAALRSLDQGEAWPPLLIRAPTVLGRRSPFQASTGLVRLATDTEDVIRFSLANEILGDGREAPDADEIWRNALERKGVIVPVGRSGWSVAYDLDTIAVSPNWLGFGDYYYIASTSNLAHDRVFFQDHGGRPFTSRATIRRATRLTFVESRFHDDCINHIRSAALEMADALTSTDLNATHWPSATRAGLSYFKDMAKRRSLDEARLVEGLYRGFQRGEIHRSTPALRRAAATDFAREFARHVPRFGVYLTDRYVKDGRGEEYITISRAVGFPGSRGRSSAIESGIHRARQAFAARYPIYLDAVSWGTNGSPRLIAPPIFPFDFDRLIRSTPQEDKSTLRNVRVLTLFAVLMDELKGLALPQSTYGRARAAILSQSKTLGRLPVLKCSFERDGRFGQSRLFWYGRAPSEEDRKVLQGLKSRALRELLTRAPVHRTPRSLALADRLSAPGSAVLHEPSGLLLDREFARILETLSAGRTPPRADDLDLIVAHLRSFCERVGGFARVPAWMRAPLERAAALGSASARSLIGESRIRRAGAEVRCDDLALARRHLVAAALEGHPRAQYLIGILVRARLIEGDQAGARAWFERAVEGFEPDAAAELISDAGLHEKFNDHPTDRAARLWRIATAGRSPLGVYLAGRHEADRNPRGRGRGGEKKGEGRRRRARGGGRRSPARGAANARVSWFMSEAARLGHEDAITWCKRMGVELHGQYR